ncbi:MAG: transporter substrate-binding domain-containing protein [Halopseudomonas sp.]
MYRFLAPICCLLLSLSSTAKACELSIVYADSWAPISSGEGSLVTGILPSLVQTIIGDQIGCNISHQGVPWGRAQTMLKHGLADAFITTPTAERLSFTRSSHNSFYSLDFVAFADRQSAVHEAFNNGMPLGQIGNQFRICDVLGNDWAKSFYASQGINFIEAPTLDNCLMMIKRNRADIIIHAADVARHKIQQMGLAEQIVSIPKVFHRVDFTLMVSNRSPLKSQLIDQVDDHLAGMKRSGKYAAQLEDISTATLKSLRRNH